MAAPNAGTPADPSAAMRRTALPLALLALLGFYLSMFLRYRPYDIDDPWFLSFSYNTFVEHIHSDQFMNVPFPAGMNGTQLFGKLAAFTQYAVAKVAGWQQRPMEILSAVCVVLALYLWSEKLRKLGYGSRFVLSFVLVAGVSEPFLATAQKSRYEFLSLLLISLGLLILAHRRFVLGMFVIALAVEVEPMAVLGLIPATILAYSMSRDRLEVTWRILAGAAAAAVIYFCLHPQAFHFHELLVQTQAQDRRINGGIFRAYFVTRLRHLPELAIFVAAACLYWRKRHRIRCHYLGMTAAVGALASALVPHGNAAYMVFIYPFLVGMMLEAFEAERRMGWILALTIAYVLPQYAWLAHVNRGLGYRSQDIRQVSAAIEGASRQIGVSDDSLRIYGDYGLWFAHPHFYRAASLWTVGYMNQADLYLCYQQPLLRGPEAATGTLYCPDLTKEISLRLVSTTDVRGNRLYLYAKQN